MLANALGVALYAIGLELSVAVWQWAYAGGAHPIDRITAFVARLWGLLYHGVFPQHPDSLGRFVATSDRPLKSEVESPESRSIRIL